MPSLIVLSQPVKWWIAVVGSIFSNVIACWPHLFFQICPLWSRLQKCSSGELAEIFPSVLCHQAAAGSSISCWHHKNIAFFGHYCPCPKPISKMYFPKVYYLLISTTKSCNFFPFLRIARWACSAHQERHLLLLLLLVPLCTNSCKFSP